MANSSTNIAGTSAPLAASPVQVTMSVKEIDLSKLNDQIQDNTPITGDELKAITAAADSTAAWAMKHLPINTMTTAAPEQGHMFRVTPLYRQIGGGMSIADAGSEGPSALIPGEWMIYGPSTSPLPAMSSLVPEKYSRLPEKHLIRKDAATKRMYVCIPASPWAPWANSNHDTDSLRCDHCICIGGRVNPAGGARALAPKALCHFHWYFMTTGQMLTRCEQLALDQLDRDAVSWTTKQTVLFVSLLKRRLGQLALMHGSQPLASLTAAQSRVVRIDYGVVGDGPIVRVGNSNGNVNTGNENTGLVSGASAPSPDDDVFT